MSVDVGPWSTPAPQEVVVQLIPHLEQTDGFDLELQPNALEHREETGGEPFSIGVLTGPPSLRDWYDYSSDEPTGPIAATSLGTARLLCNLRTCATVLAMSGLLLWSVGELGSSVTDLFDSVNTLP